MQTTWRDGAHLQRYNDAQSLERALAAFQHALESDPSCALAYAGLAEAFWRSYALSHEPEQIELGESAARRALELNDLLAPVHVTLGLLAAARGQWAESMQHEELALQLDPRSPAALRELGLAYEELGRFDEAERTYRHAVALQPGYWANHNYLGVHLSTRGRLAEAETAFRRVTQLAPDNTRGYNNLAGVLMRGERFAEATVLLQRSVSLRPTAGAFANLGTALFRQARYAEAARAMEQAVKLDEGDARLWRNLGAAYYWAPGERGTAGAAYARAASLLERDRDVNPRDPLTRARLADCYAMTGRGAEAFRKVEQALKLAPADADVRLMAAELLEHLGVRSRAIALVEEALRQGASWSDVESAPALAELRADPRLRRPSDS